MSFAWQQDGHAAQGRSGTLTASIAALVTGWLLLVPVAVGILDPMSLLILASALGLGFVLYLVGSVSNGRGMAGRGGGFAVAATLLIGWTLAYVTATPVAAKVLPRFGSSVLIGESLHITALFLGLVSLVVAAMVLRPRAVMLTGLVNLGALAYVHWIAPQAINLGAFATYVAMTSLLAVSARRLGVEHGGRMESQHHLETTVRRQAAVLESDPTAVWSVNEMGRVKFTNNLGDEFLARHPQALLEASELGDLLRTMHEDAMAGKPCHNQVTLNGPEREEIWKIGAFPLQSATGIEGVLFHFKDATDEIHAERHRREAFEAQAELQHMAWRSEFKSRILNIASHELNTPLTPMRLQLQLLLRYQDKLTPQQHKALTMIDRNANRLQRLVSDLLEMSRIDGGRLELQTKPMDLAEMLDAEVENAQLAAPETKITYSGPEAIPFEGDEQRLSQVVCNLLSNASKFCPDGQIDVILREDDHGYVVAVKDTGRGIDPQRIGELFEPFAQVHDNKQEIRGNGLGLSISKGLVEAHGGAMTCMSEGLGHGTTFQFTLPKGVPMEGPSLAG